jgi:hypothetical protein
MNVSYSDRVKQWEGYPLIQRATNRLEEILGEDAGHVTGEWDRTEDDKGQVSVTLRLRDAPFEAIRKFDSLDLRSPAQTSFQLSHMWWELLHAQNKKRLDDLLA